MLAYRRGVFKANKRWLPSVFGLFFAIMLVTSACQSGAHVTATVNEGSTGQVNDRELAPQPLPDDENLFSDPVAGGGIDLRLTRSDIDCTARDLEAREGTRFLVAHVVVNGNLGEPCFGPPDARLIRAWQILSTITPPGQLHDLGVFGGFVTTEANKGTLAFVTAPNRDVSAFSMSINLDEADRNSDELMLTMAHEFAHVFTGLPSQIARDVPPQDCATWHNRSGCYHQGSLLAEWVDLFWDEGRINLVNPDLEPLPEIGNERCIFDPSFLGPYAASHPEEDFAESFSAFVFRLEVPSLEIHEKMKWFARQPDLAEFRNRAIEAGMGPLGNTFDRCG